MRVFFPLERLIRRLFLTTIVTLLPVFCRGASIPVYSTGFEQSQGYNQLFELIGQQGWVGAGSGLTGVFPDAFQTNQVAFIGHYTPTSGEESFTSVWTPLNAPAIPAGYIARFSIDMTITDSMNREYDEFRWSVYNTNGDRFFTIVFDNYSLDVLGISSSGATFETGASFVNDANLKLVITMDFAHNLWAASLNGTNLAINRPIAESCLPLNLGDIDAVWFYADPTAPGDNYMIFDNYRVTLESSNTISQTMQVLCADSQRLQVRSFGQPGQKYAFQISTTLASNSWTSLFTNTIPATGYFDLNDPYPPIPSRRFYRTWLVP